MPALARDMWVTWGVMRFRSRDWANTASSRLPPMRLLVTPGRVQTSQHIPPYVMKPTMQIPRQHAPIASTNPPPPLPPANFCAPATTQPWQYTVTPLPQPPSLRTLRTPYYVYARNAEFIPANPGNNNTRSTPLGKHRTDSSYAPIISGYPS